MGQEYVIKGELTVNLNLITIDVKRMQYFGFALQLLLELQWIWYIITYNAYYSHRLNITVNLNLITIEVGNMQLSLTFQRI